MYVVMAYRRYGEHCYLVSVHDNLEMAIGNAEKECDCRGGKYICRVHKCLLNEVWDMDMFREVVYEAS